MIKTTVMKRSKSAFCIGDNVAVHFCTGEQCDGNEEYGVVTMNLPNGKIQVEYLDEEFDVIDPTQQHVHVGLITRNVNYLKFRANECQVELPIITFRTETIKDSLTEYHIVREQIGVVTINNPYYAERFN